MENALLPLGQSLADKHRAAELKWRGMPPGLPPEMAGAIMLGLRSGERTLADYYRSAEGEHYLCTLGRLLQHMSLHPAWGAEAKCLSNASTNRRKSENNPLRKATMCRNGLHEMTGDNVKFRNRGTRYCVACTQIQYKRVPTPLSEADKEQIKALFSTNRPVTVSFLTHGRIPGDGSRQRVKPVVCPKPFYHARANDPAFDRFIREHTENSNSVAQQIRHRREKFRAERVQREQDAKDYFEIAAMIPRWFPEQDKFDVVNDVMAELSAGKIARDQLRQRIKFYMAEANKMFAPKYRKFGDSKLVSLDEVMFDDGSTTRGDTVSRGLWD
ncbi:hypothetical protein FFI89_017370 [Bradyrhizobium sp. KBS0727]|uniref:hypothetical protein n=1 Tax=unclassified Bradyrhizobium TaxID=2631580 RepID=UPI00110F1920|nr:MULTISPECIES: hypothetical protein [unclassified Bradyrhizobium]QDW38758.1 hypothetical protein FFI71_017365 [Bradyrhizobium sp. KBS0725]QDW45362.1 hypothetical protein FFI89_017370 [Bradyrhizobium sp. KBS0727]